MGPARESGNDGRIVRISLKQIGRGARAGQHGCPAVESRTIQLAGRSVAERARDTTRSRAAATRRCCDPRGHLLAWVPSVCPSVRARGGSSTAVTT